MSQTHLAIKTGRRYTLVTVDHERGECRVFLDRRIRTGGLRRLTVRGTSERAIREAATDCAGESYRTLRELVDAHVAAIDGQIIRRRDLDC